MKVYALVGPSGTGKSHRAGIVTHLFDIPLMIDDGLLIWDGKILAGRSAKREATKLAAIRTALFYNEEHVKEVKERIEYADEDKILIIGTSVKMVEKIARTLGMDKITKLIDIRTIATKEEIEKAQKIRQREGKHVIPVPTIELKRQFPGYLLNPLELFFKKDEESFKKEKTIVRPKFSFYGNLYVYNSVIIDLIQYFMKKYGAVKNVKNLKVEEEEKGLKIKFNIILEYGLDIIKYVKKMQLALKEFLEDITGIEVLEIIIEVSSLHVEKT